MPLCTNINLGLIAVSEIWPLTVLNFLLTRSSAAARIVDRKLSSLALKVVQGRWFPSYFKGACHFFSD